MGIQIPDLEIWNPSFQEKFYRPVGVCLARQSNSSESSDWVLHSMLSLCDLSVCRILGKNAFSNSLHCSDNRNVYHIKTYWLTRDWLSNLSLMKLFLVAIWWIRIFGYFKCIIEFINLFWEIFEGWWNYSRFLRKYCQLDEPMQKNTVRLSVLIIISRCRLITL